MSDQVNRAIAVAMSKLGAPYVWATAGPATFDCSGFTHWVASRVLGPLDYEFRSSHHQFNVWGEPVTGDPIAGDLVFFDIGQGLIMGNLAGHVGMMIDPETFIHAANEDLDVRLDRLDADWYAPKFIGARRIFESTGHGAQSDMPRAGLPRRPGEALRFPAGPIRTAAPWNGQLIGSDWSLIARWGELLAAAAASEGIDPRWLVALMAIETQGIHERDGVVIEVWDDYPEDGPSVGLMQVKPKVWGHLLPDANPYLPGGNIRLGAAVLRHLLEKYGSLETAIAEGYHPGVSPNGTTPARYVEAARGLVKELDNAA